MFNFRSWFQPKVSKELRERLSKPQRPFTPDYPDLESRASNLVLLYGNQMQGGRSADGVLPIYKDNVLTADPMVMIKCRQGKLTYPVVLDPEDFKDTLTGPGRLPKAKIRGELYQLSAEEILKLDELHRNGVDFKRIRVPLEVNHHYIVEGKNREHIMTEELKFRKRVFMYVGNYYAFAYAKYEIKGLLKARENNEDYEPRYYFSPTDW